MSYVPIGTGQYGVVYTGLHIPTGETRAIKKVLKRKMYSTYMREVEILKMLDHPNILKFYETFEDETNLYIVTELCNGGELLDQIKIKKQIPED